VLMKITIDEQEIDLEKISDHGKAAFDRMTQIQSELDELEQVRRERLIVMNAYAQIVKDCADPKIELVK
tara:strand:+ start:1777 stop:1983 length:207 start_codon:yes stop_codon:yes gene_type:complete